MREVSASVNTKNVPDPLLSLPVKVLMRNSEIIIFVPKSFWDSRWSRAKNVKRKFIAIEVHPSMPIDILFVPYV